MKLSDRGIQLLKNFEGFREKTYQCPAGKPTIGYGHKIKPYESFSTITRDYAESLLRVDIKEFEGGVSEIIKTPLAQHEFDALVCLAFNIGLRAFQESTLAALLNRGEKDKAAKQFLKWCKVNEKINQGLKNRRKAELELFRGAEPT